MSNSELKILILSIAIVCCLFMSAFFSCADMVYSTANKLTLEKHAANSKRAKLALKYANEYDKTISTVVFSNNLVNIASSTCTAILSGLLFIELHLSGELFYEWFPYICTIILTLFIIAFGEVLPKAIGRIYADRFAISYAYIIKFFQIIFFPFVFVTTWLGGLITKPLFNNVESDNEVEVSDEELQEMVDVIEEEGVIDESQGELLRSAIEFKETEAHEIMTHRVDVFAFDIDDDIEELTSDNDIFEYSRVPVYQDSIDNVIGILNTKILLKAMLKEEKINIRDLIVPEINVPSGMEISLILKMFKETHNHIAIVKDEFGGTEGIITMEDILEELVGEIWDELDEPTEDVVEKDEHTLIVDGSMNIDDFFDECGIEIDSEDETDYDTVGGWCIDVLQRFANKGDEFNYLNLHITILNVTEFTVEKIKVYISPINEEDEE